MKGLAVAQWLSLLICLLDAHRAAGQTLEAQFSSEDISQLAAEARELGDAKRGAVVFYQQHLACTRCHIADKENHRLGPDLTKLGKDATDQHLIESVLNPSKVIRQGYEPVTLLTDDGKSVTGIVAQENDQQIVIRDAAENFKQRTFAKADLDEIGRGKISIMPAGQVNSLSSRQQFLDLIRYLTEIRDGGSARARELEPPPSLYAALPLPEYEKRIDHAGMLQDLDREAFQRGEKIYNFLCVNCHGTHDQPGSLPTSLRFASGKFKNGNDPYTMYQTLTRGFGMMVAQTWMVPRQKYDVIHYIRQAYLKDHNPSQLFVVDGAYLDRLPRGDTRGPEPSNILPWEQMDYGPNLVMTLEIGQDAKNFAYKGNAIRLDAGPGGVSQGRFWMVFDYDTLRVAAAWSGKGFCDWNGINFNGRHAIHPRLVGDVHLANATGPGWGRPGDGSFDDVRLVGRDQRKYGPLPRAWAQYKGMYYYGPHTIIQYTVGDAKVLEMPGVITDTPQPVFTRTFNIGPRKEDLLLQVAQRQDSASELRQVDGLAVFGPSTGETPPPSPSPAAADASQFDGSARLEVSDVKGLHLTGGDFTITARIKTKSDGTILAQTENTADWVPNGLTWFVRGGKLTVDIGWVGMVQGSQNVADGKWRDVAFCYQADSGEIKLYVDGQPDRKRLGRLQREKPLRNPVVRIGYTARNFPKPSAFRGAISEVRFYNAALSDEQVRAAAQAAAASDAALAASWDLTRSANNVVPDRSGNKHHAPRVVGSPAPSSSATPGWTVAGVRGAGARGFGATVSGATDSGSAATDQRLQWRSEQGNLRLRIPAGDDPLRFVLWFARAEHQNDVAAIADKLVIDEPERDLSAMTRGGPSRWPQVLPTPALVGEEEGPFAVDVLKRPTDNPWFCLLRLTGFDFLPGGDQMIVSAWDGSVWLVSGLGQLSQKGPPGDPKQITWRRIASGLFQPLGVKIVDGKIYVTCRDQICILHDLNGDDEIDYYECFNNDHQVTDHFHEFAMGLQADEAGNLYYAKSARHALPALVPHHGTLLRVSKDGSRTEIVANGFRAANGVCINPDGTFIVTDQEGHWNPKNRINYVKEGGFYGNMFGYHDVTDSSDEAMEQPLCWITNAFDRSPAELLWVDSERWGPLNRQLLNLSYGYGQVYIVPHELVDGQPQGGMCAFPIQRFPTGVMRGRFHPQDGQLYLCGMFAWAGNQTQPGGLYRLRYTGKPVQLPIGLNASKQGMAIRFSDELDPQSVADASNYLVKAWGLKRTANYGSQHYNEHALKVASAELSDDGRTVHLTIPDIAPTWCMEIRYRLRTAAGESFDGVIHNTIHKLRD